jgi:predicted phage tail component-like protein
MGLSIVRIQSGMINRPYTSGKDILESYPNNVLYPYFFGVKHQPLQFSVTFSTLDSNMDSDKLHQIANWLFQNKYKGFISSDNPSRMYYCMAVNQIDFITNGSDQGYFTVDFRCRDGFAWSLPLFETFDLSGITTPEVIQLTNFSNVIDYVHPEVEFELKSTNTGISLININDDGKEFKFTALNQLEEMYVNNDKRLIISSTGLNRFGKFNNGWFRLVRGINNITVTGKCVLKFRMQFPIFN